MTTQIIQAFAKAGVKMTRAERIWRHVMEKPGINAARIGLDLKIKRPSGPLYYLVNGGLLRTVEVRSTRTGKMVNTYYLKSTEYDPKGLYAGKPKQRDKRIICSQVSEQASEQASEQVSKPVSKPVVYAPNPPTQTAHTVAAPPEQKPMFNLEQLTIQEARQIHAQLSKMFGN